MNILLMILCVASALLFGAISTGLLGLKLYGLAVLSFCFTTAFFYMAVYLFRKRHE